MYPVFFLLYLFFLPGFSGDAKRLNVLLTRAKSALVVVGHQQTLEQCDIWKGWLDQSEVLRFSGFEEFKVALMPDNGPAKPGEAVAHVRDGGGRCDGRGRSRGRGEAGRLGCGAWRGFSGRGRFAPR